MERFFGWLFRTHGGWILIGITLLTGFLYFQPDLLAEIISKILGSTLNLIGMIITGILNGIAKVIIANQASLEYLFCIALLCFSIVFMLRSVFGKGGGKKKK